MKLPRIASTPTGKRFLKYFQTFYLLVAGITLGLTLVIVGPTLLDLADHLGVSVQKITFVAFGGDFGCFFGSVLGLVIFKVMSAQKILIVFMLLIALSTAMIPYGGTPWMTAFLIFLSGCGVGIIEIGAYVWVVGMWAAENVAPIIQLLHLSYGIGAFMAPLVAEPYIRHHEGDPDTNVTILTNVTEAVSRTEVHIPYAMIGCFAFANAILMIVSWCMDSSDVKPGEVAGENEKPSQEISESSSKRFQWMLVLLVGSYDLVTVLLEVAVGKFLPLYVVHHYGLDRSTGAYLVSIFYVGFTLGRTVAVPISVRMSSMRMMSLSQLGLLVCALLLTFADKDEHVLWLCSFNLGVFLAPLFGCGNTWLAEHVTLSHDFMSTIMTIVTSGALIPPLVIGSYVETHPQVLMWLVLAATVAITCLSAVMHFAVSKPRRAYEQCPLANQESEE